MRKNNIFIISFIGIFLLSVSDAQSQGKYYYAFDEKIEIVPVNDKILIKKIPSITKSGYEKSMVSRFNDIKTDWQGDNICKMEFKGENEKNRIIQSSFLDNNILSVSDVFKTNDGLEFGFTNEIVVKFKENIKDSRKISVLRNFGLKHSKTDKTHEVYTISKEKNVLETANSLYESGFFEFAYPNIICKAELFHIPNDPYFQYQVTLRNTGQSFNGHTGTAGADIKAADAWDITTGNSDIVVAVFDEGVTSNHPDLPNTRQVRLNGSNFGSGNANDPSPVGNDNHGNSCAGVIAATMDNNEGITGIAPKCKIMPLRWDNTTTPDQMASGITFAVDNGANIISNSWGYSTSNRNYIPAIISAIQYAIDNGVVVVFAAGNTAQHNSCNYDGYVSFPANANVNNLLTVGASDRYDKQSDYSPTNSLIDIVAPSHRAYPPEAYYPYCGGISGETFEMWTLDIPGNAGYNPWPSTGTHPPATGEVLPNSGTNYLAYTGRFGGTSHSCPVVAGVAALMLSANNSLTPQQIFNILTSTADKVGGYTYVSGKCNQMGYGRVNAYAAVQVACATTPVNFVNQTVTADETIISCGDINVQNVTVTGNNVKLTLDAAGTTTISSDFEVVLDSELEVLTR